MGMEGTKTGVAVVSIEFKFLLFVVKSIPFRGVLVVQGVFIKVEGLSCGCCG